MTASTRTIFQSRDLLWAWTIRTIRARYQQSALGWLWAVIQPVAQVIMFSIIFTLFIPINTGDIPYSVFSFVAITPWVFLSSSLTDMSNSIISNMNLVTKIYFPREVLSIASMFARFVDFTISGVLVLVLIIFFHIPIFPIGLLCLPCILIIQFFLIMGLGLASAAASVFYRDVQALIILGLQVWFSACPIVYPSTQVPEQFRKIYFLNPMAGIIEAYRDVLLYGRLPGMYLILSLIVSVVIFILGYYFFKRVEYLFADIV